MRSFTFLALSLAVHLVNAGSYADIQCPLETSARQCQRAVATDKWWNFSSLPKCHCNQRFIVDLDSSVTSPQNFRVVIDFMFKTIKNCASKGIGKAIFFNPINSNEASEWPRCCSMGGCVEVFSDQMNYSDYVLPLNSPVIVNGTKENNAYFTALYENLKNINDLYPGGLGGAVASTILITDRVYSNFSSYAHYIDDLAQYFNTSLSIVLVGRVQVSSALLRSIYKGVDRMDVFSVSDFDCLPRLANCIQPCAEDYCTQYVARFDACNIPTPPTTTSTTAVSQTSTLNPDENPNSWHMIYVFDISENLTQIQFDALKLDMAQPLKDCFSGKKLAVGLISMQPTKPRWVYTGMDLQIAMDHLHYFTSTHKAKHPVDNGEQSTTELIQSALDMLDQAPASSLSHTIVLISDYVSEEFITSFNESFSKESRVAWHIVALNNDTKKYYSQCTAMHNVTLLNLASKNAVSTVNWCSPGWMGQNTDPPKIIPTTATNTTMRTVTAPLSGVSTVLFISIGTCAALLVVLIGCTILYRQRFISIKNIQRFRERHESTRRPDTDDVIDYWELSWDKLVVKMEKLGSGAYGQVYRGKLVGKAPAVEKFYTNLPRNRSWENCDVAIKMLPKYATEQARKEFMNEIELMKSIGYNDNIVNMLGCITASNPVGLVLEYCSNRDMLHYLKGRKVDYHLSNSFEDRVNYTKDLLLFGWQIADGMNYLGNKNVVHRDLAARNILVDGENNAKIGDFGLCMNMSTVNGSVSRKKGVFISASGRLPIKWLALECLQKHEFSTKSDVWSYGIVLYEMYTFGGVPFQGVHTDKLLMFLEAGGRPEKPEICNDEMYEIMSKCWRANPEDRPTFQELLTIFTVLLERATENYGYLTLLKANHNNQKAINRLAQSFCMAEAPLRRQGRSQSTESASECSIDVADPESPETKSSLISLNSFFIPNPRESDLQC